MKNIYVFIAISVVFLGLGYAALYNDDSWYSKKGRVFSEENYVENPDVMGMIEDQLHNVDYAAIVYATATKTTPNSWFHRVIMGNPYDSTHYIVKAGVDHTILGREYGAITYASAGREYPYSSKPQPSFATLVLLCGDSPDNMYAPENGYEFAASKELVEYFKQRSKLPVTRKNPNICPK